MSLRDIFKNKYDWIERPSPHQKSRPSGINGIIIHSIGERIKGHGSAPEFLEEIELSSHFFIEPDGTVIQCVNPTEMAYHAGVSQIGTQRNLNTTFIGIEVMVEGEYDWVSFLEAIKDEDSFKFLQYDSTAVLCSLLATEFGISPDRIVRHSDVSGPDVRPDDPKLDPGAGFDWDHLIALTKALIDQLES